MSVFIKLLKFATSGEFLFNGQLFKQIDGVAMGSPLGPTLANLYMACNEGNWLSSSLDKPLFYVRYVDDTFLIVPENFNHNRFLKHMNSQSNNIKLTCEHEINSSIYFLDIKITKVNDEISTEVYRKPTHNDLLLNFHSLCPKSWKSGLLSCLINRAFNNSSSWLKFHLEIQFLIKLFLANSYPKYFILSSVQKFLTKKII